jgi:hypothetical protein
VSDYWSYLTGGQQPNPNPGAAPPPFPALGTTLNSMPTSPTMPPSSAAPMSASTLTPGPSAPPPMDPTDRDALIRTVAGEAGGEPPIGQAAVTHVILNRLAAGGYGDSISDIVKAPAAGVNPARGYHEFSTWNPPSLGGNKGGALDPQSPDYARIGDIVDKAYYGGTPDPTGGATHYYAPRSMPGGRPPAQWPQDWFQSAPKVKVGSQIFVGGAGGPGQKPTVVGALSG